VNVDHHCITVSKRSRSYNVTEVQDYMKKQRRQRRATRDDTSRLSNACHKRRSAPLDSNVHSITSPAAGKKLVSFSNGFLVLYLLIAN